MLEIVLPAPLYGRSSRGTPRLRRTPRALHGAPRVALCCRELPGFTFFSLLMREGKAGTSVLIRFALLAAKLMFPESD